MIQVANKDDEVILKIKRAINIKKNFSKALDLLDFTQRLIEEQADMPLGSLGGVLRNNNPTIQQLIKLSRGLGVSIHYLLVGGDPEPELMENYVFIPLQRPMLRDDWAPDRPNVAARVEMILRLTGQSKIETAKRINVTPSWWSPTLKSNNPTMGVIERIAYAVQTTPVELLKPVPFEEYGAVMIPKVSY